MKRDYHINIFYSEEDGGYIADIPIWKRVLPLVKTPDEALREVEIAKEAWLKAARAEHKSIPKPQYRPVIYHQYVMTLLTQFSAGCSRFSRYRPRSYFSNDSLMPRRTKVGVSKSSPP